MSDAPNLSELLVATVDGIDYPVTLSSPGRQFVVSLGEGYTGEVRGES